MPLILFPQKGSWLRQLTDETLSAARIEPTCSIEMDSVEAILATVEQGLGVAFLPIAVLGAVKPASEPSLSKARQFRLAWVYSGGMEPTDREQPWRSPSRSHRSCDREGLTPLS